MSLQFLHQYKRIIVYFILSLIHSVWLVFSLYLILSVYLSDLHIKVNIIYVFRIVIIFTSVLLLYDSLISLINKFIIKQKSIIYILRYLPYILICFIYIVAQVVKINYSSLSRGDVISIFQTDIFEAVGYLYSVMNIYIILAVIFIFTIYILFINKYIFVYSKLYTPINLYTVAIFFILIIICFAGGYRAFSTTYNKISDNYTKDKGIIATNLHNFNFSAHTTNNRNSLHIVIIGESLTRDAVPSWGGFHLNTTPFIESLSHSNNAIIFKNAYSKKMITALSWPTMFMKNNVIIDNVLKKVGFKTYFMGYQDLHTWNAQHLLLFSNVDHAIDFPKSKYRDQPIVPTLIKSLDNISTSGKKIIFISMWGSHLNYCVQNPNKLQYQKYYNNIIENQARFYFGKRADNLVLNKKQYFGCYDSTISTLDKLIQSIYVEASKREDFDTLTYISDHGESYLFDHFGHGEPLYNRKDTRGFIHNSVSRIPFFTIFSDRYIKNNNELIDIIRTNKNKYIQSDVLFNYLQNITNIVSNVSTKDTGIGTKAYNENHVGNTYYNDYVFKNYQIYKYSNKLRPHGVNTIGKLHDIYLSNIKSVELDIFVDPKTHQIRVGHSNYGKNGTLAEYLIYANRWGVKNLWLDIKHLDKNNFQYLKQEIIKLSNKYKWFNPNNLLLESNSLDTLVRKEFRNLGYQMSYYVPTSFSKKNQILQKENATKLLVRLKEANVRRLSFNVAAYPFVKNYIEPYDGNLTYYTWGYMSTDKLKDNKLFNKVIKDPKIKSFIINYKSVYDS